MKKNKFKLNVIYSDEKKDVNDIFIESITTILSKQMFKVSCKNKN